MSNNESPKVPDMATLEQIADILPYVIKIQSLFRKHLCLKRLEEDAIYQKRRLESQTPDPNPEGTALKQFVSQLKGKNITPEAFFRMCDINYSKTIPNETFAEDIRRFGIVLSDNQMARLLLLLDESFDEQINYSEYCNALEAFDLSGEKHFSRRGGVKRKYKHEIVEKMITVLDQKGMSAQDLFDACDEDGSGEVSVDELVKTFKDIKPTFLLREMQCIHSYFDIDNSGTISLDEFQKVINRAEKMVDQRRDMAHARGEDPDDEFGEEEIDEGDEGMIGDAIDTVKGWFGGKKKTDPNDAKVLPIVKNLEVQGISVRTFVDSTKSVAMRSVSKKTIQAFQFDYQLKSFYPSMNDKDRQFIIDLCLSPKNKGEVSVTQIETILKKHSKSKVETPALLLTVIANGIYLNGRSQNKDASPEEIIESYMKKHAKNDPKFNEKFDKINFTRAMRGLNLMSETLLHKVHLSFKKAISLNEITEAIQNALSPALFTSVKPAKAGDKSKKGDDPSRSIQGFSGLSPRSKCDAAVTQLIKDIKKSNVDAEKIWAISSKGQQIVTVAQLQKGFSGFKFNPKIVEPALASFGKPTEKVSKTMFMNTFSEKFDQKVNPQGTPSKKTRPATASSTLKVSTSDNVTVLNKLSKALLKQELTPVDAFRMIDKSGTGQINFMQLKRALKELLPENDVTPADFKLSFLAFDADRDGMISQEEFEAKFQAADFAQVKQRPKTSKGRKPAAEPEVVEIDEAEPEVIEVDDEPEEDSPEEEKEPKASKDRALKLVLSKLLGHMEAGGLTAEDLFNEADKGGDGEITFMEFRRQVRDYVDEDAVSKADFKKIMMAFDTNRDGAITKEEYLFQLQDIVPAAPKVTRKEPEPAQSNLTLIEQIEESINDSIPMALKNYWDQAKLTEGTVFKAFQKKNPQIPKALVKAFCAEANDGQPVSEGLGIGNLVRYICQSQQSFNIEKSIKELAAGVDEPVEESLRQILASDDDHIEKDEFLDTFRDVSDLDTWTLLCIFYCLDVEDNDQDEVVQFDDLVRVISKAKGMRNRAKTTKVADKKPVAKPQEKPVKKPVKQIADRGDESAPPRAAGAVHKKSPPGDKMQAMFKSTIMSHEQMKKLQSNIDRLIVKPRSQKNGAGETFEQCIEKYDYDPTKKTVMIKSKEVLEIMQSFTIFSEYILDENNIRDCLTKISKWIEGFEGNDEAGAVAYLFQSYFIQKEKHPEMEEGNSLVIRIAFDDSEECQTASKTKVDFSPLDLIIISILVTDTDAFNRLDVQPEFMHELIGMPAYNSKTETELYDTFIQDCYNRLELRVRLALLCTREKFSSDETGIECDIWDDAKWQIVRFSAIAQKLKKALSDPKKKQLYNETFEDSDNDLTYFEFYDLIMNKLGIDKMGSQKIHEQMYEDFECHLDYQATAHINRYDVYKFLVTHGYTDPDYEVSEEKSQQEVRYRNKQKQAVTKNFINDEEAYFRPGVTTILNKEKDAIDLCNQIVNKMKKGELWVDPDFGPKDDDDEEKKQSSLFFDENTPSGSIPAEAIKYVKIPDGVFIKNKASANEVKQGQLGDCWFIGALSVLATRDELIKGGGGNLDQVEMDPSKIYVDKDTAQEMSKGVYPPIFHPYRKYGIYVMRFFKNYQWRYVLIDGRIPVFASNDEPVFGRCTDKEELWVNLIEKAFAKLHGCYWSLKSGYIDDGLADLTGMVCEKLVIHDQNGFIQDQSEELWKHLKEAKHNQCLMGCSVQGGTESRVRVDGQFVGILSGHAYSLNDVFEIEDPKRQGERKTHRLLRLRNPWGQQEWNGKWSDESEEIEIHREKLKAYVEELEDEEFFDLGDTNDGTFLINYKSFREIFTRIFIANDFPDDWWCVRYKSVWNSSHPGVPKKSNDNFGQNPQYLFAPTENCELFISLGQNDGRVIGEDGTYDNYPFTNRIVSTLITVVKLKDGEDKVSNYFETKKEGRIVAMTKPLKVSAEQSLRVNLEAGSRYVIVACPKAKTQKQDYYLSLYFDIQLHDVDIRCITNPSEKYEFIMEEYEKSERIVPDWKVKHVRDNLANFIGATDKGNESMNTSFVKNKKKKMTSSMKRKQTLMRQKTHKVNQQLA